jgi:hypothetical protein
MEQRYPYGGSTNQPINLNYVGFTFVTALALSADDKRYSWPTTADPR